MEKVVYKEDGPVFETKDYRVDVIALKGDLPFAGMDKRYAVMHKEHKVIAMISEQFAVAAEVCHRLQEQYEQTRGGKRLVAEAEGGVRPPVLA